MGKQISRRAFLGKAGKIVLASPLVLKLLESDARADASEYGQLNIDNYVNSIQGTEKLMITHYDDPGISDGYESSWDSSFIPPSSGRCGIYSDIITHKLSDDYRQTSSTLDFLIQFVYKGNLSSATPNHLVFSFPDSNRFGDKPILFQSDLLQHGPVIDVRKVIDTGTILQLKDLPARNYKADEPYGWGILSIGTRLLADINDSGHVDLGDFALISDDFGKEQGQYPGDISGPNGLPDGYVDGHDIDAFCDDYLKSI